MVHHKIAHVLEGETFSGTYYVESFAIKKTSGGKDYTDMILRDGSGSRSAKSWKKIEGIDSGDWVSVDAVADTYMGQISIILHRVDSVGKPEDLEEFIASYPGLNDLATSFDDLKSRLSVLEESTKDNTCSLLIDQVYEHGSFFTKFFESPGSVKPHYGCRGGLMAATVRTTSLACSLSESYDLSKAESSVIITSGLLYLIGAVDAYHFEGCVPVETKPGVLVGLESLTMARVNSAMKRAKSVASGDDSLSFSNETAMRVLHCIVSSTGWKVKPATKEAIIMHAAVRSDSEIVHALDFIEEDAGNSDFTAYDVILKRKYLK